MMDVPIDTIKFTENFIGGSLARGWHQSQGKGLFGGKAALPHTT